MSCKPGCAISSGYEMFGRIYVQLSIYIDRAIEMRIDIDGYIHIYMSICICILRRCRTSMSCKPGCAMSSG